MLLVLVEVGDPDRSRVVAVLDLESLLSVELNVDCDAGPIEESALDVEEVVRSVDSN